MWFVVAYYGALCAGAAVAPINPAQPVSALRDQIDDVSASAVFTSGTGVDAVRAAAPSVGLIVCVPPSPAAPDVGDARASATPLDDLLAEAPLSGYAPDPELVAHLQFTGGTTGRSKAVRVLHRNLVTNALQAACWRATAVPALDDRGGLRITAVPEAVGPYSLEIGTGAYVAVAPLFHGLGLVGHNVNMLLGNTVVVSGRFDADAMLADIETHGVTYLTGSPAMYYALLASPGIGRRDLSSVRLVGSGAAPIDTTALRALRAAFPNAYVIEAYGLSEATMAVTMPPASSPIETPLGCVGVPIFDTDLEIRESDASAVCAVGEVGEVWIRGPQVTDGYHRAPDLTAAQFQDGWLRTGDMGRVDDHGHLFLVGRAKDMIIYKGYNVYPQPLEEILCSHPAVAQAAVVGAASDTAGERPVGFVVLDPGTSADDDLVAELIAYVADRVAPYQRVRELRVVEALPRTATGKILKSALREELHAGAAR
jgi:long-chain acyl-CoA synthetase